MCNSFVQGGDPLRAGGGSVSLVYFGTLYTVFLEMPTQEIPGFA
jgi:hypothetical protein